MNHDDCCMTKSCGCDIVCHHCLIHFQILVLILIQVFGLTREVKSLFCSCHFLLVHGKLQENDKNEYKSLHLKKNIVIINPNFLLGVVT